MPGPENSILQPSSSLHIAIWSKFALDSMFRYVASEAQMTADLTHEDFPAVWMLKRGGNELVQPLCKSGWRFLMKSPA